MGKGQIMALNPGEYYETNETGQTYLVGKRPDGSEIRREDFVTFQLYIDALREQSLRIIGERE